MSKKKRSKDEWVNFVRKIFSRRRADRSHKLPKDYIMSVADAIWRTNPTREIIYNTLAEFYSVAYEKGFIQRGEAFAWFKAKQEKAFDDDFKEFMTALDDKIHNTNQQPK